MRSKWKQKFNFLVTREHIEENQVVRTLSAVVPRELVGMRARGYFGVRRHSFNIHEYMVGHRFGEFVSPRRRGKEIHPDRRDRSKKKIKKAPAKKKKK